MDYNLIRNITSKIKIFKNDLFLQKKYFCYKYDISKVISNKQKYNNAKSAIKYKKNYENSSTLNENLSYAENDNKLNKSPIGTIKHKKEDIKNKDLYNKIGHYIELVKRPNLEKLQKEINENLNNKDLLPEELKKIIENAKQERKNQAKTFILDIIVNENDDGIKSIFEDLILNRNFKLLIKIIIDDFDLFNKLRISLVFLKYKKQHESIFTSMLEGLIKEFNSLSEIVIKESDEKYILDKLLLIEKTIKVLNKHDIDREKINFETVNLLIEAIEKNFKFFKIFIEHNPNEFFSFLNEFTKFENETLKIRDEFIKRTNLIYFKLTNFTLKNFKLFTLDNLSKLLEYLNKNNHRDTQFMRYIFVFVIKTLKENPQYIKNEKFRAFLIYLNFFLINNNLFFDSKFSELDEFQKMNFIEVNNISTEMTDFYTNKKLKFLSTIKENFNEKNESKEGINMTEISKSEIHAYYYPHLIVNDFENTIYFFESILNLFLENIKNSPKNYHTFNDLKGLFFIHDGLIRNFFLEEKIKGQNNNCIIKFKKIYMEKFDNGDSYKNEIIKNSALYYFLIIEKKILQILKNEEKVLLLQKIINLTENVIKNFLISQTFKFDLEKISQTNIKLHNIDDIEKINEIKNYRNFIMSVNYMKSIKNFFGFDSKKINEALNFNRQLLETAIITSFHKEFIRLLVKLNIKFNVEGKIDDVDKDIEIIYYDKNLKICLELDGYFHFYRDGVMNYKTIFKRNILERNSWKIISFKYSDWIKIKTEEEKLDILNQKIKFLVKDNEKINK